MQVKRWYRYFRNALYAYQVFHAAFSLLWLFHKVNNKMIWWILWIPVAFFIVMQLRFNELRVYMDLPENRTYLFCLIHSVWFALLPLSSILHSAF